MTTPRIPLCQVTACGGVEDHRGHLCTAHRRALTFSIKLQETVSEFLHGTQPRSAISATQDNASTIAEAGEYLGIALSLLVGTMFESVSVEPSPVSLGTVMHGNPSPWRVSFGLNATHLKQIREPEFHRARSLDDDEDGSS